MKTLILLAFLGSLAVLDTSCSSNEKEDTQFMTRPGGGMSSKEITYVSGDKSFKGFLAMPEGEGPFPAVLVVHEWWGQTDYPRERAKQLAMEGYAAFAVDMYGDGKTVDHPKDAQAFSKKVMDDMDQAEANFKMALKTLKEQEGVDRSKVGAIGYCFGGAIVLEMARRGLDLDVVASYHGNITPIVAGDVKPTKTRFLIFNGAADPFVKKQALDTARKKLKKAKIRYKLVNYKGAKHGFTNPGATAFGEKFSLPLEYNQRADMASWKQTMDAFKIVFK